jgi:hypothetical protein
MWPYTVRISSNIFAGVYVTNNPEYIRLVVHGANKRNMFGHTRFCIYSDPEKRRMGERAPRAGRTSGSLQAAAGSLQAAAAAAGPSAGPSA